MISTEHIKLLKSFVTLSRANPDIIHAPELKFYKDYLIEQGITFPPVSDSSDPPSPQKSKAESNSKKQEFEEQEEEIEIPYPVLDNNGVITSDSDEEFPNGDPNKEITDEDVEKANEQRDLASSAFREGNYETALEHYTAAIKLNPGSAMLHAKRADVLLRLSKPRSAIRDCDKAISINPDSATGYKFRGRANRLLGLWAEAHQDLALACQIDYDDVAGEWLKEVEPNAKKIQEYNRAYLRRVEEKELRERKERVQRAQEANRRAATDAKASSKCGGNGPSPANFLNDPELIKLIQDDPSLLTKLTELMQNPDSFMKYMGDPAVMKLMQKLTAKKGGGFPFSGGFPGAGQENDFSFDDFSGNQKKDDLFGNVGGLKSENTSQTQPPKKAPEPDLD